VVLSDSIVPTDGSQSACICKGSTKQSKYFQIITSDADLLSLHKSFARAQLYHVQRQEFHTVSNSSRNFCVVYTITVRTGRSLCSFNATTHRAFDKFA
jgi:recombinational DNA repair protein RecR